MTNSLQTLPDTNQNFWQLTAIQVMTYGLPCLLMGPLLAREVGVGAAYTSILIGNLILWFIGMGIVLMSSDGRPNAIQNIRNYFGFAGALAANVVLGLTFLIWYSINLNMLVKSLCAIASASIPGLHYFGIALGVFVAFLSMGGIVLIRKVCAFAFPLIAFLFCFSFSSFKSYLEFDGFKFSLFGTLSILLVSFAGQVNLPTFFRHSRSKADSVLAFTLVIVIISVFQLIAINSDLLSILIDLFPSCSPLCVLFSLLYVLVATICANLNNIYFSSAVLEFFFPNSKRWWGYLSVGLLGSLIYGLFGPSNFFVLTQNLIEFFVFNLTVVLLMAFSSKMFMKYNPTSIEKLTNNVCWFFGCLVSFIMIKYPVIDRFASFYSGTVSSILCFIFLLFIRKIYTAIKKLYFSDR